jgi:DNA polymerase I-like protein with 3'-5' exonuclease and polymerase domains
VHYYTYRHRRNSIAGGVLDEDGDPVTGFLANVREDGRIPTPADTLGANTGRYRHKIVCNVPRVTSLYGEQMRNLFGAGKGLWQLGYDFASLEARVMGHYVLPYTDGEALAISLIAEKPNDIHSINARKLGIDRNSAKSFSYAAIYGAQPKKLAKMLGISLDEAKVLFNNYWDAVPALKQLKEDLEKAWVSRDKKHIKGLDGRLLSTRSKHSLINVLFQSGGAIAAKWSAVRLAQAMEERGILGDPFSDTKADSKVWWLIHMHDEQQMACHPSLMQVKGFATEDEAKAALCEGSSAIGHGSKGPYVGFKTQPVECIDIGIKQAVKELGLRVELGFEWIPGSSWGQCH